MTTMMDDIYHWLWHALGTMGLGPAEVLAFPLFVLVAALALAVTVRLASVAGSVVLPAAARAVVIVAYLVILTAEYAVTQVLRLMRLRPPAVLYLLGRGVISSVPPLMSRTRSAGRWWRREMRTLTSRALLTVAALLMVAYWNGSYCDRQEDLGGCRAPSWAFADHVTSLAS